MSANENILFWQFTYAVHGWDFLTVSGIAIVVMIFLSIIFASQFED